MLVLRRNGLEDVGEANCIMHQETGNCFATHYYCKAEVGNTIRSKLLVGFDDDDEVPIQKEAKKKNAEQFNLAQRTFPRSPIDFSR